jgi:hypothetical protein
MGLKTGHSSATAVIRDFDQKYREVSTGLPTPPGKGAQIMEIKATVTANGKIFDGRLRDHPAALMGVMYDATHTWSGESRKRRPSASTERRAGFSHVHGEVVQKGEAMVKGIVAPERLR